MKITKHANQRMEERLNLNEVASENLTKIVLERGLKHTEATGPLRRYADKLLINGTCNKVKFYAEKAFLFSDVTLVTVIPLDNYMKKLANKLLKRKDES